MPPTVPPAPRSSATTVGEYVEDVERGTTAGHDGPRYPGDPQQGQSR
ncbi:hypothetical protein [Pseudonocardia xinjiangensis]